MHVGDKNVHVHIIVVIKHLDSHGPPRCLGKYGPALANESFSLVVLVVLVVSLHVQNI